MQISAWTLEECVTERKGSSQPFCDVVNFALNSEKASKLEQPH